MSNDPWPVSSDPPTCELYRVCREANDRRWLAQEQRNVQNEALFRRWGTQLDQIKDNMAECKINIAQGQDHSEKIARALEQMQVESRKYMDGTTKVLAELAETIRTSREAAETNHSALMNAVTSNAALAARAMDRADAAADRADIAQRASGDSANKLSTLTRATLTGWILAVSAAAALAWHFITDYSPALFKAFLQKL